MNALASQQRPAPDRPSLEGTLGDLRPMELLRLLGATRQTGTLQVLADGPVLVTLVDGAVTYATADPQLTLHDVLRRDGLVDTETWNRATRGRDGDLGDALTEAGIDGAAIVAVVRRVVLDTVVDLALADKGRFRFATGSRHALGDRYHYPVDQLVADVATRLVQWEAMRASIPSFSTVPRLAAILPAGQDEVTIAAADWQVVALVDGRRTLDELRSALATTRFGLGRRVAALVRAGVLDVGGGD
jgi:hypothetical protein